MSIKDKLMETLREVAIPRKTGSDGEKKVQEIISGYFEEIAGGSATKTETSQEPEETAGEDKKKDEQPGEPPKSPPPGKAKDKKPLWWERQDFAFSGDTNRVVFGFFILIMMALLFMNFLMMIYFDSPRVQSGMPFMALAIMVFLTFGIGWNSFVEKIIRRKTKNMQDCANLFLKVDRKAHRNLIFTAHYDSKSGPVSLLERTLLGGMAYVASWTVALYSLIISLYALIFPSAATLNGALITKINFFVQFIAFWIMIVLALMFFLNSKNESPGALDNASGVAVLTELARHFSQEPPDSVNLWFVATGAEEDGMIGMVNFLDRYQKKLSKKKTYFVNLDGVGGDGTLEVVDEYGIPPARTAGTLSDWLMEAAKREEINCSFRWAPPAVGFDSVVPWNRGYQALNVSHTGFDKKLWATHTKEDKVENINPDSLEETYKVCSHLVRVIDGQ